LDRLKFLPDLKSVPGIKKLEAKHCLCLHQFIYWGGLALCSEKLVSHLTKKKVPYFEVHAFWKEILPILRFKLASMTSSNSSSWGFTHIYVNMLELAIQLLLKKNQRKCSCTEQSAIKPCSGVFPFCLLP